LGRPTASPLASIMAFFFDLGLIPKPSRMTSNTFWERPFRDLIY